LTFIKDDRRRLPQQQRAEQRSAFPSGLRFFAFDFWLKTSGGETGQQPLTTLVKSRLVGAREHAPTKVNYSGRQRL
jgi:hypothetical protein